MEEVDDTISSAIKCGFYFNFGVFEEGFMNGWFMKQMWMLDNDGRGLELEQEGDSYYRQGKREFFSPLPPLNRL